MPWRHRVRGQAARFASVGVTGAGIYILSQATEMSVFVTNVASMIGIGVAVDYSLFVLARYREEFRAGAKPEETRRIALRTPASGGHVLGNHGDDLAGRAVPGRLHDHPLDRAGRGARG